MASSNIVEILLRLKGAGGFTRDVDKAGHAIKGVGDDADKAGRKAKGGWKNVAKWAGGAALIGGGAAIIKSSADSVVTLAKNSAGLTRATGMDTRHASEWVQVAKSRGITGQKLGMTFKKLNSQVDSAARGGKPAVAMFKELGVSQDAIAKGDVPTILSQISDAFVKMKNPVTQSAFASKLFGKQGAILLPILGKGSKALQDQLQNVTDLNASLGNSKDPLQYAADQRNMKLAMDGLKLTIGTSLMPIIVAVSKLLVKMAKFLRPITGNATLLKGVLIVLAGAFIAYRLLLIQTAVAQSGLSLAWLAAKVPLLLTTAQMWLLNAAFLANPIVWIVLGIAALVGVFIILYTKVGWFRKAVQGVWGWLKANWKTLLTILTGPIGLAVRFIIGHWNSIVGFVKKLPGRIARAASGMWDGFKKGLVAVLNWVIGKWNWLADKSEAPSWIPVIGGKRILPHINPIVLGAGGTITRGGSAIVGDRGPELLNLPRGASVQPLDVAPRASGSRDRQIVTQVYLDRRVIATAVGYDTADRLARR